MNEDSIWIMSRKISLKSMARHFAAWKLRHFVLDRTNALLGFRTKTSSSTTLIHLNSESVSVRHHYYSNDQKFCLSLTYSEALNGVTAEREMVMKFESLEKMNKWNKALSDILNENRKVFTAKTKLYFDTFSEYVREQVNLQHILGRDRVLNSFDSPEAFTNDAASSAPVEGFSSQQTAVSVDHNTSNTTNVGNDEASQEISSSPTERPFTLLTAASRSISATNTHSNAMVRSGAGCGFWQIPVPKMRILIMAVGTRGDMQPFVQLGLRLQKDGHRVRVATHAPFREYVTGKGLEFYPLAGDPAKLSEFMVKTHGFIIPTTAEQIREVPAHHSMVVDIMYSCWNACIDPDPEDDMMRPFVADAIISNPITYAHIHCAEALGVPLHLMFPQPWIPTKAFPHPLSCLSYQQGWCSENYISYQVIDRMLWMSFESNINAFRKTVLGLEPIRVGEGGWNMINLNKVPFVKMWSPTLVPKPKDWPEYVDVVGTFFESTEINKPAEKNSGSGGVSGSDSRNNSNSNSGSDNSISNSNSNGNTSGNNSSTHTVLESPEYSPSPELLSFLTSDVPIVFIGFGSMVIHDIEALIRLFLEAAALAGVRVLIQMGWSSITPARFRELALEAEVKTALVRKTEFMNRNLLDSVIFPSEKKSNSSGAVRSSNTNNTKSSSYRKRSTPEKHSSAAVDATIHAIHPPSAPVVVSGSYSSNHSSPDEKGVLRPEEDNSDSEYLVNMGLLDSPPRSSRNNKSLKHNKGSTTSSGAGGEFDMSLDSHSSSYENIPAVTAGSDATAGSGSATGSGNSISANNISQSPSAGIPAAPSNMLTGWFYTALTTFVAPKREEMTPKNSSKNVEDKTFSNTATTASGATTTSKATTTTATTATNAAKDTPTHATSHPSLSSQSEDEMSAWERAEGGTVWTADQDAFFLGPCPHSWLFKKVDAVVHHGGAGTTAAGLRYGCPTWICPFFGDQFFWGELVHRGGLGPRPTPVDSLTLDIVAESLAALRSDAMLHAASEISKVLAVEDGVEGAVEAFYRHLPIENMICDVSMFAGESRLAQVFCKDCGFKMCAEVSDLIHCSKELGGTKSHHTLTPCAYMNWSVPRPVSAADGLVQGLGGLVHELAEGVSDVLYDPVKGIYAEGLNGGVVGIVTGVHSLLSRPLRGGNLLVNRVSAGVRNSLGFQDSDSPLRTADGGSLTGMVYGADRNSSDHNKNIRRLRINSIDHPSSGSENSSGHSLKDVQAAAAHEKMEISSGKVKVFDLNHSTHSTTTPESEKMGTFSPTADSLGTKSKAPFLPLRSISEGVNSTVVSTTDGVLQIRSLIEGEISKVKTDSRHKPPSHHGSSSNNHRVRTDSNTSSVGGGSATSGGFYDSLCYSSDEDGDNSAPIMHDLLEGEGEDDNDSGDEDLHGLDRGLNTDLNHRHSSSDTNRDESASPLLFPQYSDYSADPAAGDSAPEWQQQRHARRHSQRARGVSEDSSSNNAAFLLPQTPEHINYTHSDALNDSVRDNLFEASAVQSSATLQTELSEIQEAISPIVSKDTLSAQLRALAVEDLQSSENHKVVPHIITPSMHTATLPAATTANIGAASESALGSHLHSTRLSADHPVIVAYEQAVVVQRMFELLGAKNSRFMSLEVFAQTLTRAVVRKAATSSEEDGSTDMISGGGGWSGKRGSDILNHATVLSLIKSLSRNKRYLDLVDFILLYQEIVQGGLQWTHEPQHIVTTRM